MQSFAHSPFFPVVWGRELKKTKQNSWVEIQKDTKIQKRKRIIIMTIYVCDCM